MLHLPLLIQDLGFILVTAAVVTLLFKKMGQPVVLGYLIAGFLLSSHVPFTPTVKDINSVNVWAEIGVIILLFALGLEFSFKKLSRVGSTASITAVFEIAFMLSIGYFVGQFLGWSRMDSIFLGGILSISSTTIIVRAFDELGIRGRGFVPLVFGVLVVEDILAILLLVLLSTVAISQTLAGTELLLSGARLGFFLILWFILGIYLLPPLLQKIRKLLSDETTLVVALGLCLMMVIIATNVGFSPALGAFVMGSLLAETNQGHRIEKLIEPIKNLFAAVFFVSVGMLIDPKVLWDYGPEVLLITTLTIGGKFLSSCIGALVAGRSLKHSVQAGLSLAQIGEFSFIIATLGLTLKVTSEFLYPIAVAVSAITTFSTPYLIKHSDGTYRWIERTLPKILLRQLERYQAALQKEGNKSGISGLLWQAYGWRMLINSILALSIFLLARHALLPFMDKILPLEHDWSLLALTVIAGGLATPFLRVIFASSPAKKVPSAGCERIEKLSLGVFLARGSYVVWLSGSLVNLLIPIESLTGIILFAVLLSLVFFAQFPSSFYKNLEGRFIENLESSNGKDSDSAVQKQRLAPWDAALSDFVLHPNSSLVGLSLQQSRIKEEYGVTVALIERGQDRVVAPDRNWVLMPFDRLFVIGSDDQLSRAKIQLESPVELRAPETTDPSFGLKSLLIRKESPFAGKILRDSGLRERIAGLVVGVERGTQRILSPDSSLVLEAEDLLWVVGDLEKINALQS